MRYSKIDPDYARRGGTSDAPLPPPPKPPRAGLSQFARSHLGTITVKDLVYLGGLVFTALTWAQSRASRDEVETARRNCVDSSASAIASAFAPLAPLPTHVKAIEKRQARNDQRWDRLDGWHSKAFRSPFKTPPPKFGPTAEAHGEVRYEDEEEDQ